MELNELTAEILLPLVGTIFRTEVPEGRTCDLRLIEVAKGVDRHVSPRSERDQFSLIFAGPVEPCLPQATYPMHHEVLGGPMPIFIVPIARNEEGYRYEAVFT